MSATAGADSTALAAAAGGPAARPVRVLHVITRMIVGGAQINTMLSCARIDRRRFPSEILTGVETGPEGDLLGECRERGVIVHVEPALVRRAHAGLDARALFRLVAFLRRERFDVVHTHAAKAGVLGRLAARIAGVPHVVHTAHGFSITFAQSRRAADLYLWLERLGTRLSDCVVSVSDTIVEQQLAHRIGTRGQYVVIRSGIELEKFADPGIDRAEARRRLDLEPDFFVVGGVGRLSPQKAPLDLIRAFARFARARPEARLVLAGDGPLRADAENAARSEGLGDRVRFLGLRDDVPRILRALDALALASRYEGLPRVVTEAMAAGLPVVATDVDGAHEVVTPGETGWLVPAGDVDALAGRLEALAADREEARRMGARGQARVGEFSVESMIEGLERLYARLAARG